jgi:hypothetical protein
MRISVGIVTHRNSIRRVSAKALADRLVAELEAAGHETNIVWAEFQGASISGTFCSDLSALFYTNLAISETAFRTRAKKKHVFRFIARFAFELVRRVLKRRHKEVYFLWRVISEKHLSLINQAITTGCDWTIVLEDDAMEHDHSFDRIRRLLLPLLNGQLPATNPDGGVFLNLAGNFGEEVPARIVETSKEVVKGLWSIESHTVDTACGYALNSAAMEQIINYVTHRPMVRTASIDYLFNFMFPRLKISTLHVVPNVFRHGSGDGSFRAWSR